MFLIYFHLAKCSTSLQLSDVPLGPGAAGTPGAAGGIGASAGAGDGAGDGAGAGAGAGLDC